MNEPVFRYYPSEWSLQKYARLQQPKESEISPLNTRTDGKWILFCSEERDLWLNLTATLQFVITKGNLILESIFLPNANKQVQAIARGDSVLFVSKNTSGTRQFRIKFAEAEGRNGIEQCSECTQSLSDYISFKTKRTNTTNVRKVLSNEVSTGEMAQAILEPTKYVLPTAYRGKNEDVRKEDLQDAIAFCLADPTFPSFVESVERCLKDMTTTSDGDSSRESTQQNTSSFSS